MAVLLLDLAVLLLDLLLDLLLELELVLVLVLRVMEEGLVFNEEDAVNVVFFVIFLALVRFTDSTSLSIFQTPFNILCRGHCFCG